MADQGEQTTIPGANARPSLPSLSPVQKAAREAAWNIRRNVLLGAKHQEARRVALLVHGEKRQIISRKEKRRGKQRSVKIPEPLESGVERAVDLRAKWSHKQGTPETEERFSRKREGALSRLYKAGTIDSEQLASAQHIADVAERLMADVMVGSASLEGRVDGGRRGGGFFEHLGQVRREMAYTRWRHSLGASAAPVLDMIVGDIGLTIAARRYRMHHRRARRMLIDALDRWSAVLEQTFKDITEADLLAAHAAIL